MGTEDEYKVKEPKAQIPQPGLSMCAHVQGNATKFKILESKSSDQYLSHLFARFACISDLLTTSKQGDQLSKFLRSRTTYCRVT